MSYHGNPIDEDIMNECNRRGIPHELELAAKGRGCKMCHATATNRDVTNNVLNGLEFAARRLPQRAHRMAMEQDAIHCITLLHSVVMQ